MSRGGTDSPCRRILVVAPSYPVYTGNAGDRQLVETLRILSRRHDVALFAFRNDGREEAEGALRDSGIDLTGESDLSVGDLLWRRPFDVVMFEFWHSAWWNMAIVHERQPWASTVVHTRDVHFARSEAARQLGVMQPANREEQKARELETYAGVDGLVVHTCEDRDLLREESVVTPIMVVPLLYRTSVRADRLRDREVLFVGGFKHRPNVDGLLWFVSEAWPRVLATVPDAKLTVVGGDAPPEVVALADQPGIRLMGRVPDTAPFLDAAMVSIAPLRYGAGMKGKVVEAMAAGVPVVTTSFGIQGLGARHGSEVLIGSTAEELAAHTISTLSSPDGYRELGLMGQRLIEATCSESMVAARLDDVMRSLPGSAGPSAGALTLRRAVQRGRRLAARAVRRLRRSLGGARI